MTFSFPELHVLDKNARVTSVSHAHCKHEACLAESQRSVALKAILLRPFVRSILPKPVSSSLFYCGIERRYFCLFGILFLFQISATYTKVFPHGELLSSDSASAVDFPQQK